MEEQQNQKPEANDVFAKPEMTAAEQYAYNTLPEDLRRRKEIVDSTILSIAEFLGLLKEYGEELRDICSEEYSEEPSSAYDPAHVELREKMLGREFTGELESLQIFDDVRNAEIRNEACKLGKDFVKKVTALQQLTESFAARFNSTMTPFTRSKEPELVKFEKELHQRLTDINYLTKQHEELVAAAQDAKTGDDEHMRSALIDEYKERIDPLVEAFEEKKKEYEALSKFSFRKRKTAFELLSEQAAAIDAANEEYQDYSFLELASYELPAQ